MKSNMLVFTYFRGYIFLLIYLFIIIIYIINLINNSGIYYIDSISLGRELATNLVICYLPEQHKKRSDHHPFVFLLLDLDCKSMIGTICMHSIINSVLIRC